MNEKSPNKPGIAHGEIEVSDESLERGKEFKSNLQECLSDINQLLKENEDLEPMDVKVVMDRSLDVVVIPATPVRYSVKHLARADKYPRQEMTRERFKMVLATAVPVDESGELSLRMQGNSHVSESGIINIYDFDPLEGHDFSVTRTRDASYTVPHRSGIALKRGDLSGSLFFIIY
jgi:hypothetical protein